MDGGLKPFTIYLYKNVFFYKEASKACGDSKEYSKELLKVSINKEEIFELLAAQIYAESKIVDNKFINVNKAIVFFGISIFFVIMTGGFYVLQSVF